MGIVHVVKKPCQILPYCIIKLKHEALSQNMTTKVQKFQPCSVSKQKNNFVSCSCMPPPNLCAGAGYKRGVGDDDVKITADEMSLLTMDKYTSAVATLNTEDCKICLEKLEDES